MVQTLWAVAAALSLGASVAAVVFVTRFQVKTKVLLDMWEAELVRRTGSI